MERPAMHRLVRSVAALTLILLTTLPAWGATARLRGTVVDGQGTPIPGVKITVTSNDMPTFREVLTSDKKGKFLLVVQSPQFLYQMQFDKPGYQSFKQDMQLRATEMLREEFPMDRASAEAVEAVADPALAAIEVGNEAINAYNKGVAAQRAGDLSTARTKLEQALAVQEDLAVAHIALSQVLLDQGEYATAARHAERGLELQAGSLDALQVRYDAYRALGEEEKAEAASAALTQAQDAAAAAFRLYNEGGEAFAAGDKDTALAKFQQAAELDPTIFDAHHATATLLAARGEYAAAKPAVEAALALRPNEVRTLRVAYDTYRELGRDEELRDIATRLAEADPEFGAIGLLQQGNRLFQAGNSAEAKPLMEQALALDPDLAKAHYLLGLVLVNEGDNAGAKAHFQKFLALAPDDPDAASAQGMMEYLD